MHGASFHIYVSMCAGLTWNKSCKRLTSDCCFSRLWKKFQVDLCFLLSTPWEYAHRARKPELGPMLTLHVWSDAMCHLAWILDLFFIFTILLHSVRNIWHSHCGSASLSDNGLDTRPSRNLFPQTDQLEINSRKNMNGESLICIVCKFKFCRSPSPKSCMGPGF